MRTKVRTVLTTTSVAVVGLVSWSVFPAASTTQAQAPPQHNEGARHDGDMFRTTTRPKAISISDPRLSVDHVRYTPLVDHQSPIEGEQGQTLVLFEGDIILGTEQELEQAAAARVIQQAQAIDPDDPALALTPTEKDQRSAKELKPRRFPITPLQIGQE
jgi:hypothetical protein